MKGGSYPWRLVVRAVAWKVAVCGVAGCCLVASVLLPAVRVGAQGPTATPTCTLPVLRTQTPWAGMATFTPTPVAWCYAWFANPYAPYMLAGKTFNSWNVPLWFVDENNDGAINSSDSLGVASFNGANAKTPDWPLGPSPTPTSTPTLCGGSTCTPTATATETPTGTPTKTGTPTITPTTAGGKVTEQQGVDFVNGIHTAVLLLAIGVPVAVGCLMALVFGFFKVRRGR